MTPIEFANDYLEYLKSIKISFNLLNGPPVGFFAYYIEKLEDGDLALKKVYCQYALTIEELRAKFKLIAADEHFVRFHKLENRNGK